MSCEEFFCDTDNPRHDCLDFPGFGSTLASAIAPDESPKREYECTWCRNAYSNNSWYCDGCNGAGHVKCFQKHLRRDGSCPRSHPPFFPERPSPEREAESESKKKKLSGAQRRKSPCMRQILGFHPESFLEKVV